MLESFLVDLHSFADPQKVLVLKRFFKTDKGQYGEGDKFLGVVVPNIRKVVKNYWKNLTLQEVERVLHSEFHEERLAALLVLVEKFKHGNIIERKKIYNLYRRNIKKHINSWDLVDLTAPHIIGGYLLDKEKSILLKLASSKNLWERRVAMLATFHDICLGDCQWAIKIAKILVKDKHDLIQKAVGWMLREVGKRCSINYLVAFLEIYADKMPRTMLRYAVERLPSEQRIFWLKYKQKTV
mgnify:CR=1 FL=1